LAMDVATNSDRGSQSEQVFFFSKYFHGLLAKQLQNGLINQFFVFQGLQNGLWVNFVHEKLSYFILINFLKILSWKCASIKPRIFLIFLKKLKKKKTPFLKDENFLRLGS
jgi:hypothetical protein